MKIENKSDFLKKSQETLEGIYNIIEGLPSIKQDELQDKNTAFIIVDMINGFAREGMLKSSRVEKLIPNILELGIACEKKGIKTVVFSDCHTENSPEFDSYPVHCVKGTSEAEIVDELRALQGYIHINKNSTNGFLEEDFKKWMDENSNIRNFIIAGDCTDICVLQFSEALKAHFNIRNEAVNIIVPADCVDTYDGGLHDADLMNAFALFNMMGNGIKVVKSIEE